MLAPHKNGVGGYMASSIVLEGHSKRVWSLDASAPAPASEHENMYEILPVRPGPHSVNEDE